MPVAGPGLRGKELGNAPLLTLKREATFARVFPIGGLGI